MEYTHGRRQVTGRIAGVRIGATLERLEDRRLFSGGNPQADIDDGFPVADPYSGWSSRPTATLSSSVWTITGDTIPFATATWLTEVDADAIGTDGGHGQHRDDTKYCPFPPGTDGGEGAAGDEPTSPAPTTTSTTSPAAGAAKSPDSRSGDPVSYVDGSMSMSSVDLASDAFGSPWRHMRSYSNLGIEGGQFNGSGWVDGQLPYLSLTADEDVIFFRSNVHDVRLFLATTPGGEEYGSLSNENDQMEWVDADGTGGAPGEFVLKLGAGQVLFFAGLDSVGVPAGAMTHYRDEKGLVTTINYASGRVSTMSREQGGLQEQFRYAYDSGTSMVSAVYLERKATTDTSWTTVRQVAYAYYGTSETGGNYKDLKLVTISEPAGTIQQMHYQYWVGSTTGQTGKLKYVFNDDAYARLVTSGNASTTDDAILKRYSDNYFEYDTQGRVIKEIAQGAGCTCSAASAGQGTYLFSYDVDDFSGSRNVATKTTTETRPDGSKRIVYANSFGQVLFTAVQEVDNGPILDAGFWRYNDAGQIVLNADASAIDNSYYNSLYDDPFAETSGNLAVLKNSAGVIYVLAWPTTTTADDNSAGDVVARLKSISVLAGETDSTPDLLSTFTYIQSPDADSKLYVLASRTDFSGGGGSDGRTTSFGYNWYAGSSQPRQVDVTYPTIAVAHNGPNVADEASYVYDASGRMTWAMDQEGHLTHYQYDVVTSALTKIIEDVNTTGGSGYVGLPSGWSTSTGLHLTHTMGIDEIGRTIEYTDALGHKTFTRYEDQARETRVYSGWTGTATTGPIFVSRRVLKNVSGVGVLYYENLTSSTAASYAASKPTGTENVNTNIQSLSRSYTNSGGQVEETNAYHAIPTTYSDAVHWGTVNTNFYATYLAYDHGGRVNRVEGPTGTINRMIYDGAGRPVTTWLGTDDTPTSLYWPVVTTGTNLIKTSTSSYDFAGNLIRITQFVDSSAANDRVTLMRYDDRNRLIAIKSGVLLDSGGTPVPTSESLDTQRMLSAYVYDNMDRVIESRSYDGDGLDLFATTFSSSKLRSLSKTAYDEQGRAYKSETFSVDPASGVVGTFPLRSDNWYDHRGNLIKTSQPGGLVGKYVYDGAGRPTVSYTSDGSGDAAPGATGNWGHADDVTGDYVLEQTETQYDANGNAILVTTRDRFHDDTLTGALGNPASTGTTSKARVGHSAYYYDAANRLLTTVDIGTNHGALDGSGTAIDLDADNNGVADRPTLPMGSATLLRTDYGYDAAGRLKDVTDPRGLVSRTLYDALGRTTATIEAYTGIGLMPNSDRTTEYEYNGNGDVTMLRALLPDGPDSGTANDFQETQYVYGVTTAGGSAINSNNVLSAVYYPNLTTGAPDSSAQDESFKVNALGQRTSYVDRRGVTHAYTYDVLGRMTSDSIGTGTLPTGVDGTIRKLGYTYDSAGRAEHFTSFSWSGSAFVVANDIYRRYNGFGQLTKEHLNLTGAATTSSSSSRYLYSVPSSTTNASRLTQTVSAVGRRVFYGYDGGTGASGLDDRISRLSWLADGYMYHIDTLPGGGNELTNGEGGGGEEGLSEGEGESSSSFEPIEYPGGPPHTIDRDDSWWSAGQHIEEYDYLGLGTVVRRIHPENGTELTYVKQSDDTTGTGGLALLNLDAGDQYTGLDRFGRVIDQRWLFTADGFGSEIERYQYGYDENSNRLFKDNLLTTGLDELYVYETLNRLWEMTRGTLNSGRTAISSGTQTYSQAWSFDPLGNWEVFDDNGTATYRSHNSQNAITGIDDGTTTTTLAYDANGSTATDDSGQVMTYDGWNRLKKVAKAGSTYAYEYDSLGRRIISGVYRIKGDFNFDGGFDASDIDPYLDALADPDAFLLANGISMEELIALGDFSNDGVFNGSDNTPFAAALSSGPYDVSVYTRTGVFIYNANWQITEERDAANTLVRQNVWSPVYVDALVLQDTTGATGGTTKHRMYVQQDANYNVTSITGKVSTNWGVAERYVYLPYGLFETLHGGSGFDGDGAMTEWASDGTSDEKWVHGYKGGRYDSTTDSYFFNIGGSGRIYRPSSGTWMSQDAIRYFDGMSLYGFVSQNPILFNDPTGLKADGWNAVGPARWELESQEWQTRWSGLNVTYALVNGSCTMSIGRDQESRSKNKYNVVQDEMRENPNRDVLRKAIDSLEEQARSEDALAAASSAEASAQNAIAAQQTARAGQFGAIAAQARASGIAASTAALVFTIAGVFGGVSLVPAVATGVIGAIMGGVGAVASMAQVQALKAAAAAGAAAAAASATANAADGNARNLRANAAGLANNLMNLQDDYRKRILRVAWSNWSTWTPTGIRQSLASLPAPAAKCPCE